MYYWMELELGVLDIHINFRPDLVQMDLSMLLRQLTLS